MSRRLLLITLLVGPDGRNGGGDRAAEASAGNEGLPHRLCQSRGGGPAVGHEELRPQSGCRGGIAIRTMFRINTILTELCFGKHKD